MLLELLFSGKNPVFAILTLCLILISISVHEFSHALTATLLGDQTARYSGRLTLNPFAHFDLVGLFGILFTRFGWGKPVPVNPVQLRNPERDMAIISFSGPFSNMLYGIFIIGVMKISTFFITGITLVYLLEALLPVVYVSFGLAIFNLLPIYPLDGEKIVSFLLPEDLRRGFSVFMRSFGVFLLVACILPILPGGYSFLSLIFSPVYLFIDQLLKIIGLV